MNAGLPGTGVGGLFYLLLALLLPLVELIQTVRGKSSRKRWALVVKQTLIAWGIIASIEVIGSLLLSARNAILAASGGSVLATANSYSVFTPLMMSAITLAGVILTICIVRVIVSRRMAQTERASRR
jgi:hypothetical protein